MAFALAAGTLVNDLVARFGGRADEAACPRPVDRVATPWEPHDARCLLPCLRADAARALVGAPGVLLVSPDLAPRLPEGARWCHPHAPWVVASLAAGSPVVEPETDERERALVEPAARVAPSAKIGAFAVVRAGAIIGDDCVIGPHAVVYGNVTLGERVRLGVGAVVGRPGFGWVSGPRGELVRVPHVGGVEVGDDVEIGPYATVDAGAIGATRLGPGVKLDAHVHVAHNVSVGAGTFVAAQSGFAGSSRVGARVLVGGQVGVADHVHVGDGARLAAKAGVIGDVPAGATFAGYPAVPRWRWLRAAARALGPRRPR